MSLSFFTCLRDLSCLSKTELIEMVGKGLPQLNTAGSSKLASQISSAPGDPFGISERLPIDAGCDT